MFSFERSNSPLTARLPIYLVMVLVIAFPQLALWLPARLGY